MNPTAFIMGYLHKEAKGSKRDAKIAQVMKEFKDGKLYSGTGEKGKKGKKVTNRKQAIAIAMSEADKA